MFVGLDSYATTDDRRVLHDTGSLLGRNHGNQTFNFILEQSVTRYAALFEVFVRFVISCNHDLLRAFHQGTHSSLRNEQDHLLGFLSVLVMSLTNDDGRGPISSLSSADNPKFVGLLLKDFFALGFVARSDEGMLHLPSFSQLSSACVALLHACRLLLASSKQFLHSTQTKEAAQSKLMNALSVYSLKFSNDHARSRLE